jgi:hypothetical protein
MTNNSQVICAISGPIATVAFLGGLLAAGFLPPTPPTTSTADVVALYQQHVTGIRICAISMLVLLSGLMAQYAGLSDQIKRIQSRTARSWSIVQVTLGGISLVPVYGSAIAWALGTYRLERAPEITQMLNDAGWFCLVMPVTPAFLQMMAAAFGTLSDTSQRRLFPRWYSFLSFWTAVLLMTGMLVPFFKVGPFAWNGMLAFWLPAVVLGTWVNVTAVLMWGVAKRPDVA